MKETSIRVVTCSAIMALLFGCGVIVGRQSEVSKVRKYLAHSEASEMDRIFALIELEEMKQAIFAIQGSYSSDPTGVANFHLNPKTGKVQILVPVHGSWADKTSLDDVQSSLKNRAQDLILKTKIYMPELSDGDVYVTFSKMELDKEKIDNKFGEYRNGQLILRR